MSFWDSYKGLYDPGGSYRSAGKEIKKGYQEGQGYLKPYNQAGMDQLQKLLGAQGNLLDPSKLQNEWAKGYETSPYAKQLLGMNQSQGLDAASQMGLLGSSAALGNIQQGAGNIVAQYRQKYLDDLMQKYMQGIGLGKDIYGIGSQAAANLGAQALSHGQDISGLRY